MTTVTKIPFDKEYVEQFSKQNNEPEWMQKLRLEGLDLANSLELPKPDKTNISRWNFTNFKHTADGAKIESLENVPSQLDDFIDADNTPENIIILRNKCVAYHTVSYELKAKGVIFTDIFTEVQEHSELVEKYYMTDAVQVDVHNLTALHAAMINGGVFVYVSKNV